jgi:hypothetical protein
VTDVDHAPRTRRICTPGAAAFGEFFGMLLCSAASVYAVWSTVVAFMGGRLPLTDVHLSGGIAVGIAWIFVADPLIVSLALAVTYVLTVPIRFVCAVRYRRLVAHTAATVVIDLEEEERDEAVEPTEPVPTEPVPGEPAAADRPAPARARPDGVRPRGEPARRTQPANRRPELVGPDTP